MSDPRLRAVSALGFFGMIAIAWILSRDRRRISWRTVGWGIGLQLALASILLLSPVGGWFFFVVESLVSSLLEYTGAGVSFVFQALDQQSFLTRVFPIILFMGSLFSMLYHLGIAQRIVDVLALGLSRTMRLSGAESLAAVANVFVGMIESSLVVKPFVAGMTRSELFALMTVGMGTVAGSVLVAYTAMLGEGFAGHLVTASLMAAPGGMLIAKVMEPETETPATARGAHAAIEIESVNLIDAAAIGAINGLRLAAYVGAMLIVFVALIALFNGLLGTLGGWLGAPGWTLQQLLGLALAPIALLMGIAPSEATAVGSLLGMKTVLNEFLAYEELGRAIEAGTLSTRSSVIASYALCGFANFGSLAILLGGIGGIAPERRGDVAQLGLRAIVSGSLTTFMTACLAGVLL
jgi:CNT family concentrative nucleoside transporter